MQIEPKSPADQIVDGAKARDRKRQRAGILVRTGKPQRNHPKRHGVNRRRSQQIRARQAEGRERAAANLARRRKIAAAMRAYFAYEIADLSSVANLL